MYIKYVVNRTSYKRLTPMLMKSYRRRCCKEETSIGHYFDWVGVLRSTLGASILCNAVTMQSEDNTTIVISTLQHALRIN
jgi:hypothetical protein